jgi:F0F1-type ATP synthase membrane subunit b/b'
VTPSARLFGLATAALLALYGCASAYYGTLEKFGIEKRDILTDRVEDAREAQTDAKEQFSDALERYRAVINIDGGDLEKVYDRLNASLQQSETRAEEVRTRVDEIESVGDDLFDEWKDEINEYSDAALRRQSESLLRTTQQDYRQMLAAMRRAEASMDPVLTLFNDQVLFLRHNLNARAIGSLDAELGNIEAATAAAIAEMEQSIAEAGRFISSMK